MAFPWTPQGAGSNVGRRRDPYTRTQPRSRMSRRALVRAVGPGPGRRRDHLHRPRRAGGGDTQGARPPTGQPVRGRARRRPAAARARRPPQHPFLAPNGRSGMHADAAGSGTHPAPGRSAATRGHQREDRRRSAASAPPRPSTRPAGWSPSAAPSRASCSSSSTRARSPRSPSTSCRSAPRRSRRSPRSTSRRSSRTPRAAPTSTWTTRTGRCWRTPASTSCASPTSRTADGSWQFTVDDDWDLTGQVPHDCVSWTNLWPSGTCDPVTSVMPDWQGRIWWVTRQGRVGTVDPATSRDPLRPARRRGDPELLLGRRGRRLDRLRPRAVQLPRRRRRHPADPVAPDVRPRHRHQARLREPGLGHHPGPLRRRLRRHHRQRRRPDERPGLPRGRGRPGRPAAGLQGARLRLRRLAPPTTP